MEKRIAAIETTSRGARRPSLPLGWRPRRLRLDLLATFALVSLVPITCLGLVLGQYLDTQIRSRILAGSTDSAALLAHAAQSQLAPHDLRAGISRSQFLSLDGMLANLKDAGVARITIWSPGGRVVYSDDRSLVGRRDPFAVDLGRPLAGDATTRIARDQIRITVPLRFDGLGVGGVFELDRPYTPIGRAIEHDSRMMYLLLVGGLVLLYAVLLPIVARASRRLRRNAAENERLALHDHLTGLPNRTLFRDRIDQAIRTGRRRDATVGLLLVDLDRFKEVNDTLGHHYGDVLLKELSDRLSCIVRESDSLARLGGDEFGLLCPHAESRDALLHVVERIAAELQKPFLLDGLPIELEASIGIAVFPTDGTDAETLLRSAEVAMYLAKTNRLGHAFYDPASDPHTPEHLALIGELRRALEARELVLHYQPQAELPEGDVRTVEALVRWQHPQRGLLGPGEFVPLAEHTGLIGPLTQYVLDEALAQCRQLHDVGLDIRVSVNVATRNLADTSFPRKVERLLAEHGVEGSALTVEITESSVLTDPQRASEVLCELARLGVKVAIDDFGVGYSSLSHLSQLPVDTIKIDKSFVLEMQGDAERAAIVRATIDLAHGLSLSVVAEGVETLELWAQLELLGCDAVQGYYLSRPIPPDELAAWLAESEQPTPLRAAS